MGWGARATETVAEVNVETGLRMWGPRESLSFLDCNSRPLRMNIVSHWDPKKELSRDGWDSRKWGCWPAVITVP